MSFEFRVHIFVFQNGLGLRPWGFGVESFVGRGQGLGWREFFRFKLYDLIFKIPQILTTELFNKNDPKTTASQRLQASLLLV